MTFPTIPTSAASRILHNTQADTTATRTFPSLSGLTKNSGDLLIAVIFAYQTSTGTNAAFSGWSDGFTEFWDQATSTTNACGAAYKWSDGTETGSPTVTQAGTITGHAAMIIMSIAGAHATTPPEAGGNQNGSNAAIETSNHIASWGSADNLWMVAASLGETSTSGSFDGITSGPTSYTDYLETAISADDVGGIQGAIAFRQNTAGNLDAGAWTNDVSSSRYRAFSMVVRPAAVAAVTGTAAVTQADQTATAAGAVNAITGTAAVTQADQTATAAGQLGSAGTVARTQANQTVAASGWIEITGTLSQTQPDQTSAASGQLGYSGTSARIQAAQTSTAAGILGYSGTVARTQTDQTSTASGTVGGIGEVTGTLAETQDAQTSTATGQLGSSGVLAASQANQTATAAGWITITGTVTETQDSQTAAATGNLGATGTLARTQANQTLTATGWITVTGLVARTQANQTCTATGFVGVIPTPVGVPLSVPAGSHAVEAPRSVGVTVPKGTHVVEATR